MGPRVAIGSSAEIAGQGGTLDAGYWVSRLPGEDVAQYRARQLAEDMDRRAGKHEEAAAKLRQAAAALRAEAGAARWRECGGL